MVRRRIEHVPQQGDEHLGEQPAEERRECKPGDEHERDLAPEERSDLARARADGRHRRELLPALRHSDGDEQDHRRGRKPDRERFLDATDSAQVDGRDRAHRLHGLLSDVLHDRPVLPGRCCDALRDRDGVPVRLDEQEVRP